MTQLEHWRSDLRDYWAPIAPIPAHAAHFGANHFLKQTALEKAGITRRIRPYDLRHAFATYILEAGVDAGTAAKLMGHTDTSMIHRHYQHVLNEQKEKAIRALPELDLEGTWDTPRDTKASFWGDFSYPTKKIFNDSRT